ncbi:hypothetical protein ATE47_05520 [Chryseobacterium sp. IHB B 17019]|nr:hypothetical protein ATE47_05520 [Chryseobacterium sp. IHB B 17019]
MRNILIFPKNFIKIMTLKMINVVIVRYPLFHKIYDMIKCLIVEKNKIFWLNHILKIIKLIYL